MLDSRSLFFLCIAYSLCSLFLISPVTASFSCSLCGGQTCDDQAECNQLSSCLAITGGNCAYCIGSQGICQEVVTPTPTPTPTPNTSVCAEACGYHFVVPSASGSLAETCFLSSSMNCMFCQDLLHLMSEAQDFAPCSGTEPNVTPTATPTPIPTATPTPYPTSTYLPNVTFAPVWVPTIAHVSGGVDLQGIRADIVNSTGVLGNFSASYLDWIDGIVVQITEPVYQIVALVDTPMQWLIDIADTILGMIEGYVDEYLDYAEIPLEVIKMAVNSFPDKLKALILYAMGLRLLLIGWKGL